MAIEPEPPAGVKEKRLESRFPVRTRVEVSWVDQRGHVTTHLGTVMNHSDHGLGLKMDTRAEVGAMLWMRDVSDQLVKAVVRYSRNHETGGWQTGVRVVNRDLRAAGREPVRGAAELKWSDVNGRSRSIVVSVVDLSDSGVGVVSAAEIAKGQSVHLIGEQFECFCVVRHCRETEEGRYRIGLLFARQPHDRTNSVTADWLD